MGQSCRWTDTPKPRVMKPTTGSPGTGVQHLANFTRQLSRPSTMMPDSLRLAPGMSLAGVESWGEVAWAANRSALAFSFLSLACWRSSSRMRLTAFWAVMPP